MDKIYVGFFFFKWIGFIGATVTVSGLKHKEVGNVKYDNWFLHFSDLRERAFGVFQVWILCSSVPQVLHKGKGKINLIKY